MFWILCKSGFLYAPLGKYGYNSFTSIIKLSRGCPTHAGKRCEHRGGSTSPSASTRPQECVLCVQFEAGLSWSCCQGVCLCKCVCGCLFVVCWFCADSRFFCFPWLVDWLFGSMCARVLFRHLGHDFVLYSPFLILFVFFLHFGGALWLLCNTSGSILLPLVGNFTCYSYLAQFIDSWAPIGHPWGPFW